MAFQDGDPSAFEEIHRRHYHRVERVCRRYLVDAEDARDACQETMLRVFRGLSTFSGDCALRSWTVRIATNVCLDILRRRSHEADNKAAATIASATHVVGPCEALLAQSRSEDVHATLSRMPEPQRRVLLLRELHGRSHVEIGNALGMTAMQAKALIYRARQRFREQWHTGARGALVASCSAGSLLRTLHRRNRTGGLKDPTVATALSLPAGSTCVERLAAAVTIVIAGATGIDVGSSPYEMASPVAGSSAAADAAPSAAVETPRPDAPAVPREGAVLPGAAPTPAPSSEAVPPPTQIAAGDVPSMPAVVPQSPPITPSDLIVATPVPSEAGDAVPSGTVAFVEAVAETTSTVASGAALLPPAPLVTGLRPTVPVSADVITRTRPETPAIP